MPNRSTSDNFVLPAWYRTSDDLNDKLIMYDIYKWISTEKPVFDEFAQHKYRSSCFKYYVKNAITADEDLKHDPTGHFEELRSEIE